MGVASPEEMAAAFVERFNARDEVAMRELYADVAKRIGALRGNHDQFLLDFLRDGSSGPMWLAFGGAATRIPLSTLGLMQYITPVFQFLLAVFYFDEAMSPLRWLGFLLVWTSLVVMSVDGLRSARNRADDLEVIEPD